MPLRSESGEEITLLAEFSPREREILLAGGVLRMLRREGEGQPEGAERVSGEAER